MTTAPPSIRGANWRLNAPTAPVTGLKVCVPTIHPAGDQRVIRCAQAAVDLGLAIHFVWLGSQVGDFRHDERVHESVLPPARSFRDRIRSMRRLIRKARSSDADVWHIHDFYLLPFAYAWSRRTGRPVLYDVHEYYPEYYSRRIPAPVFVQRIVERLIRSVERWFSSRLAAADAVSETLAERFRSYGVPAASTPNFPAIEPFDRTARPLTPDLLRRVIHTGTLTSDYGSELLVEIARQLAQRAPEVQLTVVAKFPSDAARADFAAALSRASAPANVTVVDPVPSHEIAALLTAHGIGLSTLQDKGQAALAVPTKLYEYAAAGLAIVASDLPATRGFVRTSAVGALAAADRAEAYVRAILDTIRDADAVCGSVDARAEAARAELSWDAACAPALQRLLQTITQSHEA